MDTLPPEVLEDIVSHVADDDLRACCLVSSRFRDPCQARLHREVVLSLKLRVTIDAGSISPLWRTHMHFEAFPHLATHVRTCTLRLAREDLAHATHLVLPVVSTLRRLVNVRAVFIEMGHMGVQWEHIPVDIREATLELLHRASRQGPTSRISLQHIHGFPIVDLADLFSGVYSLQLIAVSLSPPPYLLHGEADDEAPAAVNSTPNLNLKSLSLEHSFFPNLRLLRRCESLETLSVQWPQENSLATILRAVPPVASILQHLEIMASPDSTLQATTTITFPKLRLLRLEFSRISVQQPQDAAAWSLPHLLSRLVPFFNTSKTTFERLEIRITISLDNAGLFAPGAAPPEYVLPTEMNLLDAVLAGRLRSKDPPRIEIGLHLRGWVNWPRFGPILEEHYEVLAPIFRAALPHAVAAGLEVVQWDGKRMAAGGWLAN
ncbi:F-box domain-containing protein [Mycena chlorophos]|uniref:F-box domain-containing protein n=1 Tax=Mycena chlorophos TaxID=658473 RepID=A0A8H6SB54_MYCCL|nr:F-box domain-containing protein [Mycena chlorophos]